MSHRFHKNAIASGLALVGLLVLLVSFWFPCVTTYQFGSAIPMTLPATVHELWRSGSVVLALIVGVFSMVFPVIKLTGVLLITSPAWIWGEKHRHRAHRLMEKFGALSLLDVFVVALLIVLVKVGGFLKMEASAGIFLFAGAVVMSIAASFLVMVPNTEDGDDERPAKGNPGGSQREKMSGAPVPWLAFAWFLVVGLLFGFGMALLFGGQKAKVESVTVRIKAMSPQLLPRLESPDYRIVIRRANAGSIKLVTKDDTPIGNGLTWDISGALDVNEIDEVELWEDGILSDSLVDRIRPEGRISEGEKFIFSLDGPLSQRWLVGVIFLSATGLLLLWWLIAWLAKHAVRA